MSPQQYEHNRLLRQRWLLSASAVLLRAHRVACLIAKANFDPNQPRVPSGNPDGGRWTRVAGWRFTRDDEAPPQPDDIPFLLTDLDPLDEEPPHFPQQRPTSSPERTAAMRRAARIMLRDAWRMTPPGRAVLAARWLIQYNPLIEAYNDPPRTLAELQERARNRRFGDFGYDVHHIVERTPAAQDGFPQSMIEAPENKVLISRLKHWELNSWFQTSHRGLGDMTPRQYVQNEPWEERRRIGLMGLKEMGVLIQ
jgi:hypothetical protein